LRKEEPNLPIAALILRSCERSEAIQLRHVPAVALPAITALRA
jgi:hypothetical protein